MSILLRQKIRTNLEFQGRKITTEIPPYKTLKYVKELAKNLFYPINSDIKLVYQHKDITPFENSVIGDFFKRKNQIFIKILPYYQNDKEKYIEEEKKFYNNINKSVTNQSKQIFICSCKNDIIGNYCRNCKDFICNICRINKEHENHRVTQVDIDNLVESVKLYAITLQSEVLLNIKSTREFCKKNEMKNSGDKNVNSRHQIIQNKYDKIYDIYSQCIKDINPKNNINKDADLILAEYIQKTNVTNDDIEQILTEIYMKYTKQRKGMTTDEFNNYFKMLGEKEVELENQSTDILAFRVNFELDEKMNQIYDKLENVLDLTLNSKTPLGLDPNTFYLYNIVKERKEKEKLKNDNSEKEKKEEEKEYEEEEKKEEEEEEKNENNEINDNNENEEIHEEEENEDIIKNKKLGTIKDKNLMQNIEKNDLINKGVLNENDIKNNNENNNNKYNNNENNNYEDIDNENNDNEDINNDYNNNDNNNYEDNKENNEDNEENNNGNINENDDVNIEHLQIKNNEENENEEEQDFEYQENEEEDKDKENIMKENSGNY